MLTGAKVLTNTATTILPLDTQSQPGVPLSTGQYVAFGDKPFHFAVQGLYGCTSIVLVSKCGVYMVCIHIFSYSTAISVLDLTTRRLTPR